MSLLQYPGTLNLNQAVVSLWYRIPKESADAAKAQSAARLDTYNGLCNIVPLLTFGPQITDSFTGIDGPLIDHTPSTLHHESSNSCLNGHDVPGNPHGDGTYFQLGSAFTKTNPPSFIGILFRGGEARFVVDIQTSQHGTQSAGAFGLVTGYQYQVTSDDCPPLLQITTDVSFTFDEPSIQFGFNGGISARNIPGFLIKNPTEHWHHLLMSWDVGGTEITGAGFSDQVSGHGRLFVTHDRVSYTGNDLPGFTKDWGGGGPNDWFVIDRGGRGTFVCPVGTIPTSPLSIPAPPKIADENGTGTIPVLSVEMAELRIYAGVTTDTSTILSAFVTDDGKPGADKDIKKRMGDLRPAIQLTGSGHWRKGKNSGTAGDLVPTGEIDSYKPDPSLFGKQA